MLQVTAYPNPELLNFDGKAMYRQSLSIVLDGIPCRFYRYTSDPIQVLPPGNYTIEPRINVRQDKLVIRPEFRAAK
jgi:hypothetical protein